MFQTIWTNVSYYLPSRSTFTSAPPENDSPQDLNKLREEWKAAREENKAHMLAFKEENRAQWKAMKEENKTEWAAFRKENQEQWQAMKAENKAQLQALRAETQPLRS